MALLTRSSRDRLSRADVESLGRHGGDEFVVYRNREYRLATHPMGEFATDPLKDDEIRIIEERVEVDRDGYESRHRATFSGRRVADGTLARLQQEATARKAKATRKSLPRFVDVIATLAIAQGKGGNVLPLGPLSGRPDPTLLAEYGLRRPPPPRVLSPRTEAVTTVRGVLERISHKGVVLVVIEGHLVASPPSGRWPAGVAEAVTALEPLIVGLLSGKPVPCGFRHEQPTEATTLLFPRMPSCGAH
jgi:hypothetical protein